MALSALFGICAIGIRIPYKKTLRYFKKSFFLFHDEKNKKKTHALSKKKHPGLIFSGVPL